MFTIVVYDAKTKVVLCMFPFYLEGDMNIGLPFGCLKHNSCNFAIFNGNIEPVLEENDKREICIVENKFFLPKGINAL